ncbi:Fe(3+) ABC transporter substrate-binding protein [Ectothiorhodospiraceae bacterium BW-2]|nr:Fe(3+) ABC transporter substrate-binding protein [Ectothiorhodospiraceae bacterium BW-2]
MRFQPLLWLLLLTLSLPATAVNIYSARKEALIKPLLDQFTAQSGIEVNLVTGKADALLQRLIREGEYSPADLLLTTDAGRLYRAQQAGVLSPLSSASIKARVAAHYRDPDGYWTALSVRTRPLIYAKDRVKPEELESYEALTDEKWRNRICIRSSNNIYNQSLAAAMIALLGETETETWMRGLVANFARKPQGGDRDQIKAVATGQCDVAVVNAYYLGMMLNSSDNDEREAANRVALFWPNQSDRGTHINVSGIGLTRTAKNRDDALQLIEFLLSDHAQKWYAEQNHEYPVVDNIPVSATLKQWGEFKGEELPLHLLGEHNATAVKLMDRAGWR